MAHTSHFWLLPELKGFRFFGEFWILIVFKIPEVLKSWERGDSSWSLAAWLRRELNLISLTFCFNCSPIALQHFLVEHFVVVHVASKVVGVRNLAWHIWILSLLAEALRSRVFDRGGRLLSLNFLEVEHVLLRYCCDEWDRVARLNLRIILLGDLFNSGHDFFLQNRHQNGVSSLVGWLSCQHALLQLITRKGKLRDLRLPTTFLRALFSWRGSHNSAWG